MRFIARILTVVAAVLLLLALVGVATGQWHAAVGDGILSAFWAFTSWRLWKHASARAAVRDPAHPRTPAAPR